MSIPPKKERKYVECFKSNRYGSCNHCRIRSWNIHNKIYAMKKEDGKWLACTDKQCYLEQGGKLTLFSDLGREAGTPTTKPWSKKDNWDLSTGEVLDLRKAIHEKFGDDADMIWFVKILPALQIYRYVKREKYTN